MIFIAENLRTFRKSKDLTQEEVANLLHVTPQSVSKWERGDSYPDISFLPALANLFETSIDALIGMDTIQASETRHNLHKQANEKMKDKAYQEAANIYEDGLQTFPNDAGIMAGLASALAFLGESERAIMLFERSLSFDTSDKSRATTRATLCFLYLKIREPEKALVLASTLPHTRESREVIQPLIVKGLDAFELDRILKNIILGI